LAVEDAKPALGLEGI
jgi:hypothetical protein